MTVKEYVHILDSLIRKHPEIANFQVVFSSDNEGNDYQLVYQEPTLCQIHNPNTSYVEMVGFQGDETIDNKDLNALCIN
jgi:hypothetical protein